MARWVPAQPIWLALRVDWVQAQIKMDAQTIIAFRILYSQQKESGFCAPPNHLTEAKREYVCPTQILLHPLFEKYNVFCYNLIYH
jgi:hypothetical protein